MNKKLMSVVGLMFLAFVAVAYSFVARGDSSSFGADDAPPSPAVSTTASGESEISEGSAGAAVAEKIKATDEGEAAVDRPLPSLELPKPENDISDQEFGWSQLLSRDSILPVYEPEFAPATEAPYDDEELVIGVAINGEAKAYAIGPLNGREMVNDTVGGIPVLVTW